MFAIISRLGLVDKHTYDYDPSAFDGANLLIAFMVVFYGACHHLFVHFGCSTATVIATHCIYYSHACFSQLDTATIATMSSTST